MLGSSSSTGSSDPGTNTQYAVSFLITPRTFGVCRKRHGVLTTSSEIPNAARLPSSSDFQPLFNTRFRVLGLGGSKLFTGSMGSPGIKFLRGVLHFVHIPSSSCTSLQIRNWQNKKRITETAMEPSSVQCTGNSPTFRLPSKKQHMLAQNFGGRFLRECILFEGKLQHLSLLMTVRKTSATTTRPTLNKSLTRRKDWS